MDASKLAQSLEKLNVEKDCKSSASTQENQCVLEDLKVGGHDLLNKLLDEGKFVEAFMFVIFLVI